MSLFDQENRVIQAVKSVTLPLTVLGALTMPDSVEASGIKGKAAATRKADGAETTSEPIVSTVAQSLRDATFSRAGVHQNARAAEGMASFSEHLGEVRSEDIAAALEYLTTFGSKSSEEINSAYQLYRGELSTTASLVLTKHFSQSETATIDSVYRTYRGLLEDFALPEQAADFTEYALDGSLDIERAKEAINKATEITSLSGIWKDYHGTLSKLYYDHPEEHEQISSYFKSTAYDMNSRHHLGYIPSAATLTGLGYRIGITQEEAFQVYQEATGGERFFPTAENWIEIAAKMGVTPPIENGLLQDALDEQAKKKSGNAVLGAVIAGGVGFALGRMSKSGKS